MRIPDFQTPNLAIGALAGRDEARMQELSRRADDKGGNAAEVAKQLEAVFATMLVKEMRNASPGSFFGEDSASDVYGGWFDQHVGESIANQGGLHIGDYVQRLLQSREGEQS